MNFSCEAVRDDGRVRNPIVLGPNAGFRVDIFGRFSEFFFGVPLTKEKLPYGRIGEGLLTAMVVKSRWNTLVGPVVAPGPCPKVAQKWVQNAFRWQYFFC